MNSYAGKILFIDLTTGEMMTEPTADFAARFLGGRGINQWLVYKTVKPNTRPLDSGNVLAFGTGVLCGTTTPGAQRISVAGKNALTGGIGFSNAGGRFAPALKRAGFDNVIFTGRSPRPVYLSIVDGKPELCDARDIWGRTTWETEDQIHAELGTGVEIGSIGPAGENLTKMGAIFFNKARAAGRCGLGSVMGSKNLKAIAVGGHLKIGAADQARFDEAVKRAEEKVETAPSTVNMLRPHGSLGLVKGCNDGGLLSYRNWQDDRQDPSKIDSLVDPLVSEYETKRLTCGACPIRCSHYFEVKDGPYAGAECEGIQANIFQNFGSHLDIDYAPFLVHATAVCSQLGLDADVTAGALGWAFESFQRGLLTEADTDGLKLEWGDYKVVDVLLQKIAKREGFGDVLAEGGIGAARKIGRGSEQYVVHIKGNDQYEAMRAVKGWALGTAVATRGGAHLDGAPVTEFGGWTAEQCESLFGVSTAADPEEHRGKGKVVSFYEKFKGAVDCLGVCYFTTQWECFDALSADDFAELTSAATGIEYCADDLMTIGERVHNIGKAFNTLHAGFTREDDWPVDRFFDEPVKTGPMAGRVLDRQEWNEMLDEYYEAKDWDKTTGLQTRQSLEAIGLDDVADDLDRAGKLPG